MQTNLEVLSDSSFGEKITSDSGLSFISFSADWCPACQAYKPILQSFAKEQDDVHVYIVNVEESPKTTEHFAIRRLPTTLLFWNDVLMEKLNGVQTLTSLNHAVNRYSVPA